MIDLSQIQPPDDSAILDTWMESFGLACTTAADELGIFDSLVDGPLSVEDISSGLELGVDALNAICKVLVSYSLLVLDDSKFNLTDPGRAYWVSTSPLYRGNEFMRNRKSNNHERVIQTAKEGWAPISQDDRSFTEMWEKGELTQEAAKNFTSGMNSVILAPSISMAKSCAFRDCKHVIDVGGGSGAFCSALTANNPEINATVMDLPQVCKEAKQYVSKYGQQSKVEFFPANFFTDDWPTHGDAFYFSNILHDWPVEKCQFLLKKAFEALPSGGKIFIHECLLDTSKTSPRMTVIFNLLMYMNHRAQQFTFNELKELLLEAGFKSPEKIHEFSYYSLVTAVK